MKKINIYFVSGPIPVPVCRYRSMHNHFINKFSTNSQPNTKKSFNSGITHIQSLSRPIQIGVHNPHINISLAFIFRYPQSIHMYIGHTTTMLQAI